MNAPSVEPVDLGKRRQLDVLDVAPRSLAVDQFGLKLSAEALGERVIVAVDGGDDLGVGEALGVADAEALYFVHCDG